MTMQISAILRRAQQVSPNSIATIHLDRQQTWTQFLNRVQKLAGAFQALGVQPGDRIALLSLNSDRYIEYFYATVWAGAAMMPMNIRWAPPECAYALISCYSRLGLTPLFADELFTVRSSPKLQAPAYRPLSPAAYSPGKHLSHMMETRWR